MSLWEGAGGQENDLVGGCWRTGECPCGRVLEDRRISLWEGAGGQENVLVGVCWRTGECPCRCVLEDRRRTGCRG